MKGWGTRAVATMVATAAVMAGVGGLAPVHAQTNWLDELVDGCPDLYVLGMQGTTESSPDAPVKVDTGMLAKIMGPMLDRARELGASVDRAYVPYPGSFGGITPGGSRSYVASVTEGEQNLSLAAQRVLAQCPSAKLAVVGYSQGAHAASNFLRSVGTGSGVVPAGAVAAGALFGGTLGGIAGAAAGGVVPLPIPVLPAVTTGVAGTAAGAVIGGAIGAVPGAVVGGAVGLAAGTAFGAGDDEGQPIEVQLPDVEQDVLTEQSTTTVEQWESAGSVGQAAAGAVRGVVATAPLVDSQAREWVKVQPGGEGVIAAVDNTLEAFFGGSAGTAAEMISTAVADGINPA